MLRKASAAREFPGGTTLLFSCKRESLNPVRCLFCKQDSSNSLSREHIVPESLGNVDHILPCGVVCDSCNNYLARKVEKPILDSRYFQERRFKLAVPNKRNLVPPLDGIYLQLQTKVRLEKSLTEGISVSLQPDEDASRRAFLIRRRETGTLIFPMGEPPNDYQLSRFIGKIGLEVLAQYALQIPAALDEIVDKPELDELRTYVRRGSEKLVWPLSHRPIYSADFAFTEGAEAFQILHEYRILTTPENECFIVVAIYGEEFALNLGGPDVSGYAKWLTQNGCRSPLYPSPATLA